MRSWSAACVNSTYGNSHKGVAEYMRRGRKSSLQPGTTSLCRTPSASFAGPHYAWIKAAATLVMIVLGRGTMMTM